MTEKSTVRFRYPARAVVLIAGAALLCIVEVAAMVALWMPLFPMLFAAMVGQCFVLAGAVDYAVSVRRAR